MEFVDQLNLPEQAVLVVAKLLVALDKKGIDQNIAVLGSSAF